MENKNNSKIPSRGEKVLAKVEKGFVKAKKLNLDVQNTFVHGAAFVRNGQQFVGQLAGTLSGIQKTHLESQKLKAQTEVELKRIDKQHDTINKHIETEYHKQSRVLDKSEQVIDKGLEDGNLDYVLGGLNSMVNIANHNPMADLKKTLDNQIENFDDDDFTIEI